MAFYPCWPIPSYTLISEVKPIRPRLPALSHDEGPIGRRLRQMLLDMGLASSKLISGKLI